jgi:hypothetical protein
MNTAAMFEVAAALKPLLAFAYSIGPVTGFQSSPARHAQAQLRDRWCRHIGVPLTVGPGVAGFRTVKRGANFL